MTVAPLDELRALPPPLQRAVLARIAAEHGPEHVAALRWQIEAHRRPAQVIPSLDDMPAIWILTGEYGSGKTQLATWVMLRALLDWRVERPRLVGATRETVRDTLVLGPSGLLPWLPPWISREWQWSIGHAGLLRIDGIEVSCLSADAGSQAIGSGAGFVLFDDYAKCVETLGEKQAERALIASFKSLREAPGKMILPTTPDGAELVLDLARAEGMRGVEVLDLGRTEDNKNNLSPAYVRDVVPNLRRLNRWQQEQRGAFAHIEWSTLRVREVPRLRRAIVFVDPAKSQRSHACKVGIVGVGIDERATVYGLADRSEQRTPDGPSGWPATTHALAEELEDRYGLDVELGIETNTLGEAGVELLRAEERARRSARGEKPVSIRRVHKITSKPNDPKTRRAAPIVALAESGQVRLLVGLGGVERSLSSLVDEGKKSDEGDAFVAAARILAELNDAKGAEHARRREAAREAGRGIGEANRSMPAPAFSGDLV